MLQLLNLRIRLASLRPGSSVRWLRACTLGLLGLPGLYSLPGTAHGQLASVELQPYPLTAACMQGGVFKYAKDAISVGEPVAVPTTRADCEGTMVFRAEVNLKDRWGNVRTLHLCNRDGSVKIEGPLRPAADALDNMTNTQAINSRRVFITTPGAVSAVHFKGSFPAYGLNADQVSYLRGDRTREGGLFPRRSKRLGPIVNSSPYVMQVPTAVDALSPRGFKYFVFVGSHNGMLHAFEYGDGRERFAYIPSMVVNDLHLLTKNPVQWRSYVDAPPTVGKVELQPGSGVWMQALVSGVGAGGKGVFALNVTDPATVAPSDILLWEFTTGDDAGIGNVIGRPRIVQLRTGVDTKEWFAVVASGMNGAGEPAIFFMKLGKPKAQPWMLNTNYYKVSLPSASQKKGVADFSIITHIDGTLRRLYAGDLAGKMWRIDFETIAFKKNDTSVLPVPPQASVLFDAGSSKPITTAPVVVRVGTQTYAVGFGTGKYLEPSDVTDLSQQTYYMLLDSAAKGSTQTLTAGMLVPWSQFKQGVSSGWHRDYTARPGERHFGSGSFGSSGFVNTASVWPVPPVSGGCTFANGAGYYADFIQPYWGSWGFAGVNVMPLEMNIPTSSGRKWPRHMWVYTSDQYGSGGLRTGNYTQIAGITSSVYMEDRAITTWNGEVLGVRRSEHEGFKKFLLNLDMGVKNWRRVTDYQELRRNFLKNSGN